MKNNSTYVDQAPVLRVSNLWEAKTILPYSQCCIRGTSPAHFHSRLSRLCDAEVSQL